MIETQANRILRDLGDGLVIRHATAEDIPALEAFGVEIFAPRAGAWMRHLARGDAAICGPNTYLVAEDTKTGQLVSSLCLITQHWSYEGIPFTVGQPEFVLTRPEYRDRGLIREQMHLVHAISAAHGDLVQAITGIPFYYRQFGYEMTVDLSGARVGIKQFAPRLKEGESEPYLLRPATEADLPFITQLVAENTQRRSMLANVYSEAEWRYMLTAWEGEAFQECLRIITTPEGEAIGLVQHHGWLRPMQQLAACFYELIPGVAWAAVTPSVIRYLCATGEEYAARNRALAAAAEQQDEKLKDVQEFTFFNFWLGPQHPAYDALPTLLGPEQARRYDSYAWYIRVPDIPAFLRHIQPVLEQRLAASVAAGYTGAYTLGFYRSGYKLIFEQGKLKEIEPFKPQPDQRGDVLFPNLTFLHVLFGFRTVDELNAILKDCYTPNENGRVLTAALFPKRASALQSWSSDG